MEKKWVEGEGLMVKDSDVSIGNSGNSSALSDGLVGETIIAELEIWIRYKTALKENDNRKFDKGYKFALEDVLSKIRDIREAN